MEQLLVFLFCISIAYTYATKEKQTSKRKRKSTLVSPMNRYEQRIGYYDEVVEKTTDEQCELLSPEYEEYFGKVIDEEVEDDYDTLPMSQEIDEPEMLSQNQWETMVNQSENLLQSTTVKRQNSWKQAVLMAEILSKPKGLEK